MRPPAPDPAPPSGGTDTSNIFIFQDFQGTNGAAVSSVNGAGQTNVYSNAYHEAGRATCMRLPYASGATTGGYYHDFSATPLVRYDEIWFCIRNLMPPGFSYVAPAEGGHLKTTRFHTLAPNHTTNYGYDDIYLNPNGTWKAIYEGEQVWSDFDTSGGTYAPVLGVIESLEFYVKFDTVPAASGGQARMMFWRNGVLIGNISNRITLFATDGHCIEAHYRTYWNGACTQNQSEYIMQSGVAIKRAAGRDDTPYLALDAGGNKFINLGAL